MKKKIIFRADGNPQIGLGHLYRLFALVEMYKDTYEFVFITKKDSTISVIPKEYPLVVLPKGLNINNEPKWLAENYTASAYILIADGYQFVASYQQEIKKQGFILMYIDDLATEYMHADIVVNHAPKTAKVYKSEHDTRFALGTKYAILRPVFLKAAQKTRYPKSLNKAFICFGGSDPENLTLKTKRALTKIEEIEEIHIVLGGAYNHDKTYLKESNVFLYSNLNEEELYKLMRKNDIGFVSSSTILYEALSSNLIIFTGYFIKNQMFFYKELEKSNIFIGLDDLTQFDFNTIKLKLSKLTKNEITMQIDNQKMIIDGKSKQRFNQLLNQYD